MQTKTLSTDVIKKVFVLTSFFLVLALYMVFAPVKSFAANPDLKGKLGISYSASSGKLTAVFDSDQKLSYGAVYTWYRDGSTVGTGVTYNPNSAGTYYCTLKDSNSYEGMLTSSSITLYRATGNMMTFDNSYGLYEVGDTVTATATLSDNQAVTNWKTNATGVYIPETGSTVSFRMPGQNVLVTATIKTQYSVMVYGGTADKYDAYAGEVITLTASDVGGKKFVSWSASGGRISDQNARVTTLTMGNSNVVVTANFQGEVSTANTSTTPTEAAPTDNGKATASHAVYNILNNGGYNVQVYHHAQGPLCEAAFRYAQGRDWLVTDYFNITINNSLTTYETPNSVTIKITIPDDIISPGRHWRMVCISRNGQPYSFEDQDSDDSTITFTTNRFYAYAMCYNDIQESVIEEIPVEETPVEEYTPPEPTSTIHSAGDSKTSASTIHGADASVTLNGGGVATAATNGARLKSDQKAAVERANGASVALINM